MSTAFSRSLWYKDTGDSNRLKLLTGKTNVKLQPNGSSYPTGALALTETGVASGIYKNDTVSEGLYKLYIDDVYRSEFGIFYITDDDVAIYAKIAGGNTFTGLQTMDDLVVYDSITGAAYLTIALDIVARELFVDSLATPFLTNTPTYGSSLIWKDYLEYRLANINVTPYQESSNFRRCIPNGTTETNKVYPTLKSASQSFASPSANNECNVHIPGTGSSTRYVTAIPGTCINYVNFSGAGRHIHMVFSDGSANSIISKFENLTIYFGANDYSTARTIANKTFINCTIYAYKDTTFSNCTLINCRIIHSSTYKAYLTNATIVELCGFNNEYDKSGLTSGYVAGAFGIDVTTLPTDPSTAISEE